jgi:hypothetical protein
LENILEYMLIAPKEVFYFPIIYNTKYTMVKVSCVVSRLTEEVEDNERGRPRKESRAAFGITWNDASTFSRETGASCQSIRPSKPLRLDITTEHQGRRDVSRTACAPPSSPRVRSAAGPRLRCDPFEGRYGGSFQEPPGRIATIDRVHFLFQLAPQRPSFETNIGTDYAVRFGSSQTRTGSEEEEGPIAHTRSPPGTGKLCSTGDGIP